MSRSQQHGRPADTGSRRRFLRQVVSAGAGLGLVGGQALARPASRAAKSAGKRIPVIDCTDLYHPPQDPGDNVDLVTAYALPEIDLKAVILDVTEKYRRPPEGRRDAGFIPVTQLNAIFGRNVPCAVTPYTRMKSPADKMLDAPAFQQNGINLLLQTLRDSPRKVEIVSFGSARAIAVAFNRRPDLLREKVRRIHLSAGASSPDFIEWNVALDPHAFVRMLRSDLPIAIHPCATKGGPFAYGRHNSFWKLKDLRFIERVRPALRAYLAYALSASRRSDFLRALEEEPSAGVLKGIVRHEHKVWETGTWLAVSGRKLVRRADGHCRIVPGAAVLATDKVLPNELRPCTVRVRDSGGFTFQLTDRPTNFLLYDRRDPAENEKALREALPELYVSFRP